MNTNDCHTILRSAPYFLVPDVGKTVEFYQDVLGFRCEYSAGDPLTFAICSRDGFSIMLRRVENPELICPIEKQGGTWEAFFWVSDADGLCSEMTAKGADIVYGPLIQESYGMREFAVRDCDGHVLGFGQELRD